MTTAPMVPTAAQTPAAGTMGTREAAERADPRYAAVWRALAAVLAAGPGDGAPTAGRPGAALTVVDAGGGSGWFAVPLAERGHRVTVVDPSQDALAALASRAADRGVADRVTGRQGDLSELTALVGAGEADLLLCHAVLDHVDRVEHPERALADALRVLRPGGWLSLLVAGRAGAVLARALAGRFDEAARALAGPAGRTGPGDATRRFDTAEVVALVEAAGAEVVAVHGVRVFADLATPTPVSAGAAGKDDREPAADWADRLAELEAAVAAQPPYRDLAAQLHVLARRPLAAA